MLDNSICYKNTVQHCTSIPSQINTQECIKDVGQQTKPFIFPHGDNFNWTAQLLDWSNFLVQMCNVWIELCDFWAESWHKLQILTVWTVDHRVTVQKQAADIDPALTLSCPLKQIYHDRHRERKWRRRSWMKVSESYRQSQTRERKLFSNWSELSMWDTLVIFGSWFCVCAHVARVSQNWSMCDFLGVCVCVLSVRMWKSVHMCMWEVCVCVCVCSQFPGQCSGNVPSRTLSHASNAITATVNI